MSIHNQIKHAAPCFRSRHSASRAWRHKLSVLSKAHLLLAVGLGFVGCAPVDLTACGDGEDLQLGGHADWRLPDVKALQSIVDYDPPNWAGTRMVIDTDVFTFNVPMGKNLRTAPTTSPPNGAAVAPFFWSSTTHGDQTQFAAYVCFGPCWAVEARGFNGDVHGPGAQRSDPKDDQRGNI